MKESIRPEAYRELSYDESTSSEINLLSEYSREEETRKTVEEVKSGEVNEMGDFNLNSKFDVEFEGETLHFDSWDWRNSHLLKIQILSGFLVFILFGLSEQTVGALIPELQKHYRINDIETSLIFMASTIGYFLMALLNDFSHVNLGVRGVVVLGCASLTTCFLVVSLRPPYFIFVLCYILSGIGLGSLDASFNTWMGCLVDSNQLLGILHGCYGIGCMITPPLVSNLLERKKNPWMWNEYYLVLCGVGSSILVLMVIIFRHETPKKYKFITITKNRQGKEKSVVDDDLELDSLNDDSNLNNSQTLDTNDFEEDHSSASLSEALKVPLVWLFCIVLFLYVGGEVSFGSWLITYLTRNKHLKYKLSSYMATSFWFGLTTGRMVLGFATAHFFKNELKANFLYIFGSFTSFIAFWLLSNLKNVAILFMIVFIAGTFVGPIFPTTIVASLQILPTKFHASGVGFICAFGGGGAAALPFLIGAIAESSAAGLRLMPLMVVVIFGTLCFLWIVLMIKYGKGYGGNRI